MTIDEAMRLATAHHHAGRLADAEGVYRQVLAAQPANLDAAYQLGVLYVQAGHPAEGAPLIEQVVTAGVNRADVLVNLATAYRLSDRRDKAVDACRRALAIDPSAPGAWSVMGASLVESNRLDEAIPAWEGLIRATSGLASAEAWSNLGVTYERLGRLAEAEAACRRAIAANPSYAPGHNNLGAVLAAAGRVDEALAAHHAALAANPAFARAYVNLAHTAQLAGRLDDAVAAARRAVELAPADVDARRNLAAALQETGDVDAASRAYAEATAVLSPLAAPPGLARELWSRLRLANATLLPQVYHSPDDVRRCRDRITDGIESLSRDGVRADLTHEPAPTLFALAYQGHDDRPIMEAYGRLMSPPATSPPGGGGTGGRIKVGFVSRFFRGHTIGRLNLGLVQQLDREKLDVVVFSVGDYRDDAADAFRRAADRHVVLPPQLPAARDLIAREACDVLLYTDLGMDPVTYSLAFSRLAAVQCTTWGHPVTSGVPAVDYFLSAADLELPGSESQYTERLVKLKELAVYYHRPTLAEPATRSQFGLDDSWTLYGCLQMLWKFHPAFDDAIAGVLRRDPAGRLLLVRGLNRQWDDALMSRWRRAMPDVAGRVVWLDRMGRDAFLAVTSLCDVMLDPTHFCGGNTSYEAFAFGVPVVTLPSPFLRGRLTYAMYRKMGLDACVASSVDDYVERAVAVATRSDLREAVRRDLRERALVLYENRRAVREFESFVISSVAQKW